MDRIQPEIPADLRALMAEIGPKGAPRGHIKLMVDRFTAVHKRRPADDLRITGDITYGDHPRQMFNVYVPKIDRQDRASLLFVQGGAFVDGHRNRNEEIYSCRAISAATVSSASISAIASGATPNIPVRRKTWPRSSPGRALMPANSALTAIAFF